MALVLSTLVALFALSMTGLLAWYGIALTVSVIKAIALGARAVLVGRPVVWGLAAGGESGARRVLELLRAEVDQAMALCGCPTVGEISRDLVV